jgi:hypothetical protein
MNYELIFNYYKSFCTQVSNISDYFRDDSTFFFVGDFGKTFVAYGKQQIQEQINYSFWNQTENSVKPIAYNINIEQKKQSVCVKPGQTYNDSEVAVIIIGTIKAVHSSDDIRLTKLMGRKFTQTFSLYRNTDNKHYCKSTVLAFLAPSDAFNEISMKLKHNSSNKQVINDSVKEDLKFAKIVQSIDELIDEENVSNDQSDSKTESKIDDLLPISMNELFIDDTNCRNGDKVEEKDPFDESFGYLNDIWSQTWNNNQTNSLSQKNNDKEWIENLSSKVRQSDSNQNSGTSFADKLRNGLQHSWQNLKLDEKTHEIRIIQNCGKSRFKPNNWQNCGKTERRPEFVGQQNITIIGAQNLEEIPENNTLFVANIPLGFAKTDFMALFDIYGKVLSVKFVERTGVSFAFIYFDS